MALRNYKKNNDNYLKALELKPHKSKNLNKGSKLQFAGMALTTPLKVAAFLRSSEDFDFNRPDFSYRPSAWKSFDFSEPNIPEDIPTPPAVIATPADITNLLTPSFIALVPGNPDLTPAFPISPELPPIDPIPELPESPEIDVSGVDVIFYPSIGREDTEIPIRIILEELDTDSEVTEIRIYNVPEGSVLSAGTLVSNGLEGDYYLLTPEQLEGLTIIPPEHSSDNFNLSVEIITVETAGGATAIVNGEVFIDVIPVADDPIAAVNTPASGDEDTFIPIEITSAKLQDLDGSETLEIRIFEVPSGSILKGATKQGSYYLVTDIDGLQIKPPSNSSDDFTINLQFLVIDSGPDDITTSTNGDTILSVDIDITPVADVPTLNVNDVTTLEDQAVSLNISSSLLDTDGSETLEITISGVPTGATLSAGTDNGDGSWTLTQEELAGLTLQPEINSDEDFDLTITATATEGENSDTAEITQVISVNVEAVADKPNILANNVIGDEDTEIPLSLSTSLIDDDGSETLNITISNVPDGAVLSTGVNNGDGTWTLTSDQLTGLTITPPYNSGDDFTLTATAESVEAENGDTSSVSQDFVVTVNAIADGPVLNLSDVAVNEDESAPLNLDMELTDTDGSEFFAKVIITKPNDLVQLVNSSGAPIGIDLGSNQVELTYEEALQVEVIPPPDSDLDFQLTVELFSEETENGDQASTVGTLNVLVNSQVDDLIYDSTPLTIQEDEVGTLDIKAELTDTDGSESLVTILSGIPNGTQLTGATDNGDGTWTVDDYNNLQLTPITHSDVDFVISIQHTVTESETGESRIFNDSLNVTIEAVADIPNLSASDATGDEDTSVPLNISSSLVDTDGSEAIVIIIDGVPANASLSAGTDLGDGSWQLTSDQLAGLTLTPIENLAGEVVLTVTARATEGENGDMATATETITVIVNAIADAPELTVTDASGDEDTAIALTINTELTDTDGSEELSIVISNVPTGAVLSAGTDNGDGSWNLTQGELSGLTITPPLHSDDDISLNIVVTSTEDSNSDEASTSAVLNVTVNAIADTPLLTVLDASGDEDTAIDLSISSSLVDTDASEELIVTIADVPIGATLNKSTDNGDGTWTLSEADLVDLTITPVEDDAQDFTLTVTATAEESSNGDRASISDEILVTVNAVADPPIFTMSDLIIDEDGREALSFATVDTDSLDNDGSESYVYVVSGVPDGFSITNATDLGDGNWQLTGLPRDSEVVPPTNFNGQITLTMEITSIEDENGDTATTTDDFLVTVEAVADAPNLTVQDASGDEDTTIPLSITTSLNDTDGSESLSITITGVPDGASLSAGIDNGGGSWSLTPAELTGLSIILAPDDGEDFQLTVTATATEANNGDTAETTDTINVIVRSIADIPTLSAPDVATDEDTAAALDITTATTDIDGSEVIDNIVISNMPSGASLSAGTDNGDGTWTLSEADLAGLTITPPLNSDEDFTITITTNVTDPGGTSSSASTDVDITITAVTDSMDLVANDVTIDEDTGGGVDISAAFIDSDGSETAEYFLTNVPTGITIQGATEVSTGRWQFNYADRESLVIIPIADDDTDFTLTFEVITTETSTGDTATTTADFNVLINAISDAPTLSAQDVSTNEDTSIAINITTAVTDVDGSESIDRIVISGAATGSTFNAGIDNGDGSWTFTEAELSGLTFTPPLNSDVDQTWTVTSYSVEAKTTDDQTDNESSTTVTMNVEILGVTDDITYSATPLTINEDEQGRLIIDITFEDSDGSEVVETVLTDIPIGSIIVGATDNGDGSWTVTDYDTLAITPPLHSDDDFTISITHTLTETETGQEKVYNDTLDVTVVAVADTPNISAQNISGQEDELILLEFTSSLVDTDGSETISYEISNIPDGASFNNGTDNGDGTWSFTAAQIAGLGVVAPLNFSGSFDLTITAIATEARDSSVATNSDTFTVSVDAIADPPIITPIDATTLEDTTVDLDITIELFDTDGSESLTNLTISGIPSNAALNKGTITSSTDGFDTYTLAPEDLVGLTYTPSLNSDDDIVLTITGNTVDENGTTNSATAEYNITVTAVADTIEVTGVSTSTDEDTPVALQVGFRQFDNDGSEVPTFQVELLEGSKLNVPDSQILTTSPLVYEVSAAQLTSLIYTPPEDFAGTTQITFYATTTENNGGDFTTAQTTIDVIVNAKADVPLLTNNGSEGDEDTTFPLNLVVESADNDGSETISVTVTGLPIGATLQGGTNIGGGRYVFSEEEFNNATITPPLNSDEDFDIQIRVIVQDRNGDQLETDFIETIIVNPVNDGITTPAGTSGVEDTYIELNIRGNLGDLDGSESITQIDITIPAGYELVSDEQSYPISDTDQDVTISKEYINSLRIRPPVDSNVDFTISAQVTTTEENGEDLVQDITYNVEVVGVIDPPTFSVADISTFEDSTTADDHNLIQVTIDPDSLDSDGSESYEYFISGLPDGATFNKGFAAGLGRWVLTEEELEGLYFIPTDDSDEDFTLTFNIIATENDGATETFSTTFNVNVDAIADQPSLDVADAFGDNSTDIQLTIIGRLNDNDGSETLDYVLIPSKDGVFHDSEGNIVGSEDSSRLGAYVFTAEEVQDLYFNTTEAGQMTIIVEARSTEQENGDTAVKIETISLTVFGDDGEPGDIGLIDVIAPDVETCEDQNVQLDIDIVQEQDEVDDINTIILEGLPDGALIVDSDGNEVGTNNGGGSWTLGEEDLGNIYLQLPPDYSEDFEVTVTYNKTDGSSGIEQSTTDSFTVTVNEVDDFPPIADTTVSINEDEWTDLNLDIGDFGEDDTSVVLVTGIPDGAEFSAGNKNDDGSWSILVGNLPDLQIRTATHDSTDIDLHFEWVPTTKPGCTPTITDQDADITINVNEVADDVIVNDQAGSGNEDTSINLTINAQLIDTDGSETITAIHIINLPANGTIQGIDPDGRVRDINDLVYIPNENFNGQDTITIEVTTTDNDGEAEGTDFDTNITTKTLTIDVAPVTDPPDITFDEITFLEDTSGDITYDPGESDLAQSYTITFTNVPEGAILSAGLNQGGGEWVLTGEQLSGLTITPPLNYSGSFTIGATISTEDSGNGDIQTQTTSFVVNVTAVADIPGGNGLAVDVTEGEDAQLVISGELVDIDGSETLSFELSGFPEGVTLSNGTYDEVNDKWILTVEDTTDLYITNTDNVQGDFIISGKAIATESSNGDTAEREFTVNVTYEAVADTPNLTLPVDVTGDEDTEIPLNISASLNDTDGSETLTLLIEGLPSDAILSAGEKNSQGAWVVQEADISSLTVRFGEHVSGEFEISVTARAVESSNNDTEVLSGTMNVLVRPIADQLTLTATSSATDEGSDIPLNISVALIDQDGSEVIQDIITIDGLPEGFTLSAGSLNTETNKWEVSKDQLTNLLIIPTAGSGQDFQLTIGATTVDTETTGTDTLETTTTVDIVINDIADPPLLETINTSGNEDTAIDVNITAELTDTDGSESLVIVIEDPEGGTFSAGSYDDEAGTWTLTPAQLSGLTYTPPLNFSGDITFNISATSTEANGGDTETTVDTVVVTVIPVADQVAFTLQDLEIDEDTSTNIEFTYIDIDTLDLDGSEEFKFFLDDVPDGFTITNATELGDGRWELQDPPQESIITPPENFFGEIELTLEIESTELANNDTAIGSSTFTLTVNPIIDPPILTVAAASGNEDTAIALNISAELNEDDTSGTISILISGVPSGATLNAGSDNSDGSWTLSPSDLENLTITPPLNVSDDFNLTVTATATDSSGSASSVDTISVEVSPVADPPTLSANDTSGKEDTAITVAISSALVDTDGSETLAIEIDDSTGGSFSAGVKTGNTWTLTVDQLEDLTYTPEEDYYGDLDFNVRAIATDGSDTATASDSFTITVKPVIDLPTLNCIDTTGLEDTAIPISIAASLNGDDPDEILTITIYDPKGGSLSAGIDLGGGFYECTPSDLIGLTYTPASNSSGIVDLAVTATVSNPISGEDDVTTTDTLTISVTGVADAPNLNVIDVSTTEDTPIALSISGSLNDTDGSETISYQITDILGGSLSAGIQNGNIWTLTEAELSGLTYTPPENYSGPVALTVSAICTESDGDTETTTDILNVTVTPIADIPTLSVPDISVSLGLTNADIDISSALTDDSETLSFEITSLPLGVSLNAGTLSNGTWSLDTDDLDGLQITGLSVLSTIFDFTVTAISTESDGSTATISDSVTVNFNALGFNSLQAMMANMDNIEPNTIDEQALYANNLDEFSDYDDYSNLVIDQESTEVDEIEVNESQEELTDSLEDSSDHNLIIEDDKPMVI